jgi:hypothetical protein
MYSIDGELETFVPPEMRILMLFPPAARCEAPSKMRYGRMAWKTRATLPGLPISISVCNFISGRFYIAIMLE